MSNCTLNFLLFYKQRIPIQETTNELLNLTSNSFYYYRYLTSFLLPYGWCLQISSYKFIDCSRILNVCACGTHDSLMLLKWACVHCLVKKNEAEFLGYSRGLTNYFLDVSKAFEGVWHTDLFYKLPCYGLLTKLCT